VLATVAFHCIVTVWRTCDAHVVGVPVVIRTPANNRIASVVLDLLVSREVDLLSAVLPAKPVAVSRRISKIVTRRSDPHTNEVITCRHTAQIEATSDETERSTAEWSSARTNERCVPYKPNRNVCSFDFHHRHANGSEQNEVTPLCDELHSSAVGGTSRGEGSILPCFTETHPQDAKLLPPVFAISHRYVHSSPRCLTRATSSTQTRGRSATTRDIKVTAPSVTATRCRHHRASNIYINTARMRAQISARTRPEGTKTVHHTNCHDTKRLSETCWMSWRSLQLQHGRLNPLFYVAASPAPASVANV
jgi:hypothetical protein